MTTPSSSSDSRDRILAEFVDELDAVGDRAAVISDYARRYPDLADELRSLAAMEDRVRATAPPADPTPAPRLEPGRRLGDFEIVEFLADGGMGEVYRAVQVPLFGRTVAVKVVRRGRTSPLARVRFLREQQVLARLHHTHIVPIHAAGQEDGVQYFAMAFIHGATLHRVIETVYTRETSHPGGPTPSLSALANSLGPTATQPAGDEGRSTALASVSVRDVDARVRLSRAYYRSVADVMAQAADAVQHAHAVEVCHRDIKPSNLMVDRNGHCWIIDFGLASLLVRGEVGVAADGAVNGAVTRGPMGTPQYMAPEQHDGRPEKRSDVWGLGATLYELLTLRRAFDGPTRAAIAAAVQAADPRPLGELAPDVPPDLAAICLKALRRDPADRYQTPGELAADLRRWLGHEPTVARPARVLRRVGLWAVRNKGWAAALVCSGVAVVALGGTAYAFEAKRASDAARRAADAADAKKVAEAELALFKAAQSSSGVHEQAWSRRSWAMFDQVAQVRRDGEVRDLAAATLVGFDAEAVKKLATPPEFEGTGSSGIAYSRDGRYVLAGGLRKQNAWLWDSQTGREVLSPHPGEGPVGFTRDGRPIQVVLTVTPDKEVSFLLWDVAGQKEVAKIPVAIPFGMLIAAVSLSDDAALLATVLVSRVEAGKGRVIVWEAPTGKVVRQIDRAATDVATSPDGKWLAAGGEDGRVTLWPLPAGDPLHPLNCGRTAIQAIAFNSPVRRSVVEKKAPGPSGRLAVGDIGGTVTVWDLDTMTQVSRCLGSHHGVHAVAFSPDGVTLASAGRVTVKVWNSSTGRQLLELLGHNWMNGVAFAPDGLGLAATGMAMFRSPGGVNVWRLEDGRGVRTFRGLEAQVSLVVLSPDGKWLAALSHDWQVAVWEMATGRLVHVLDVPVGRFSENAGLAFDADGKRLGVSAGNYAQLWDVVTGRLIDRWTIPEGLSDQFAFHPDGQVLHLRWSPWPVRLPGGFRIRELQPGGKVREIKKLDGFRGRPEVAEATPDGRYFVVCGWEGAEEYKNPAPIQVFHSQTGEPLWPTPIRPGQHFFEMDPTGRLLRVRGTGDKPEYLIVETLTGRLVQSDGESAGSFLGPGGEYSVGHPASAGGNSTFQLYRKGRAEPVVSVGLETRVTSMHTRFTADGRRVFWGNSDGTVMVCDVPEVQRRLAGLGLGW